MCGIAGIFEFAGEKPERIVLERMGEVIAHRGPDGVGYFLADGFGVCHRRLSIIDLSSAGHQPMLNEDDTVALCVNGEIYNFLLLRAQLEKRGHSFRSRSDSEVILHGYEEWGDEVFKRLRGMFAIALFDTRRRRLLLARDRVGVKPMYYWRDGRRLLFASEGKAIACHPGFTLVPSEDAIGQYFTTGYPTDDSSWFEGVRQVMPGEYVVVEDAKVSRREYWTVPAKTDDNLRYEDAVQSLRQLLVESVDLHLVSDVAVGSHLSGGLDSSTIAALASRRTPGFHTFSAAYPGEPLADERKFSDLVSRHCGTVHHQVLLTSDGFFEALESLIWHMDEPCVGPALLPMYRVSALAKRFGVTVVNGGQGADELLAGYSSFIVPALRSLANEGVNGRAPLREWAWVPFYARTARLGSVAWQRFRRRSERRHLLRHPDRAEEIRAANAAADDVVCQGAGEFECESYRMVRHYLRGLLHPEDRMSMACSVESRVPLLDHPIVELAMSMPSWFKIRGGWTKAVMRDAVREWLPAAITYRRDKKGYPVPIGRWFRHELRGEVETRLLRRLRLEPFVDEVRVREVVVEHMAGEADHGYLLFKLLCAEEWLRQVETGEIAKPRREPLI